MKRLAKIYYNKIDIKNRIIELSLTTIKDRGRKYSIEFDLSNQLLDREILSLLYIKKRPQIDK